MCEEKARNPVININYFNSNFHANLKIFLNAVRNVSEAIAVHNTSDAEPLDFCDVSISIHYNIILCACVERYCYF
jgi:hypothetical protein